MKSRLVLTLVLASMFAALCFTAAADPDLYGPLKAPGPGTNAVPSYLGSTGLLITPTAMVMPPLKAGGFYHQVRTDPHQSFWGATVGLPGGLELSAARLKNLEPLPTAPEEYRSETVVNAKYQVPLGKMLGNPLAPKVAVGVIDASNEVNRTYFLTLSRSFTLTQTDQAAINLHVGWGNTNKENTRLDGFFAGADFSPFRNALLQIEYDAKDLNAGIRLYPTPWLSLDAGVVNDDFAWGATARSEF